MSFTVYRGGVGGGNSVESFENDQEALDFANHCNTHARTRERFFVAYPKHRPPRYENYEWMPKTIESAHEFYEKYGSQTES